MYINLTMDNQQAQRAFEIDRPKRALIYNH